MPSVGGKSRALIGRKIELKASKHQHEGTRRGTQRDKCATQPLLSAGAEGTGGQQAGGIYNVMNPGGLIIMTVAGRRWGSGGGGGGHFILITALLHSN